VSDPAVGDAIGQFRVVRELGFGGMGVVFEAYDPALDRSVAIKLVRDRAAGTAAGERLIREAQAMAKLAHPNVIAVHEVGVAGNVYIVMELVRGETLDVWLKTPRSWREIVRVFLDAGRGLAAAHAAGLVHRDFKPSNVLVDPVGHVRVGDFGLARDEAAGAAPQAAADASNPTQPVGTPMYMAPEQWAGEPVDARADQYSFAVSLERSLAGKRVPRRIRTALARATDVERERRFPVLDGLLDELRHALDARRRLVVVASTGVTVAAVTTALAAWWSRPAANDCAASAHLVDQLWTPAARDGIAQHFLALRPGARTLVDSTTKVVDRWASTWTTGRIAACRSDSPRRPAHVACLDRDLGELNAQLDAWRTGNADIVDHALSAATSLPDPAACAGQIFVSRGPHAAAVRARTAALKAVMQTGNAVDVKPELEHLVAEAGTEPDLLGPALLAVSAVELEVGDLDRAREHAARAAVEMARVGDDDGMVRAIVIQAAIATAQGHPQDGLGLLDAGEAIVARSHLARPNGLTLARADALTDAGRPREAITVLEQLIRQVEPRAGNDPGAMRDLDKAIGALATAHTSTYEYAEARDLLLRAKEIELSILGPAHPEVGKTLHDLGNDEARLGDYDKASLHIREGRDIMARAYGEDATLVWAADSSLAGIELQRGNYKKARPMFEHLLSARPKAIGRDHPYVASAEEALGYIDRDEDHCKDALPHLERALAIDEKAGRGGATIGIHMTNIAVCLVDVGRWAEARKAVERGMASYAAVGTLPAEAAELVATLADIEAHDGHRARAIELAQKAIATLEASPLPDAKLLIRYEQDQIKAWKR
jgi:tetratricopeptide (TPR) repeat protein